MAGTLPVWAGFAIFGGIVASIGGLVVFALQSAKKRTAAFRDYAVKTRSDFSAKSDPSLTGCFPEIELFQRGHTISFENIIRRADSSGERWLFDYSYRTGRSNSSRSSVSLGGVTVSSGRRHTKNSTIYSYTVAAVISPALKLPDFTLAQENIFHKIASAAGFQDIDLPDYPEFSKMYLLRGSDEQPIRDLFKPEIVKLFEGTSGVSLEGSRNTLVIYSNQRLVGPDDLESFENLLTEIKGMITR